MLTAFNCTNKSSVIHEHKLYLKGPEWVAVQTFNNFN